MHEDASGLSEGLFYEDILPLGWEEVGSVPATRALNACHANEQLLRYLAAVEEREPADEGHSAAAQDMARLDLKIGLLLDMVGQLLSRQVDLPEAVPLRLGPDRLCWTAKQPPRPGARLAVDVYLNPRYPSALRLFGTVTRTAPAAAGHAVELAFGDMGEAMQGALEKMIFRQHRRVVAQARQASKR
jgi:hypothetical protein